MKIIEPTTPEEFEKYYDLRFEILRKPWNQPKLSTKDEYENISIHFLMLNDKQEAVASGRLQINSNEEGQIRSMAVRSDMQGKGLGTEMIKYIEQKVKERNLRHITLDARENAVKFYEKNGYKISGKSYLLFGMIQHYRMEKKIEC